MSISRRTFLMTSLALPFAQTASAASIGEPAPAFEGLENWINSKPVAIDALRGRVVLVDFWTFACSNCVNTLPWLADWHQTLEPKGLTIVGVHTPEFPFERDLNALRKAVSRHGILYPVAQDNRYQTWKAYRTRYWPTAILIDRSGRIVQYHEGDGGFGAFGTQIKQLVEA